MLLAAAAMVLVGCQQQPEASTASDQASRRESLKQPAVQEEAASARSPAIGKTAPDFSLKDQDDRTVKLSALRGQWVILYFYPKDDTPGCTCQATEFTNLLTHFRDMNARILGVSEDSVQTHKAFVDRYKLGLDLLSDPTHQVMRSYGAFADVALGSTRYGRVIRCTYLMDPKGIIRYHWPEVIPEGHARRVRQKLAALQVPSKR
jgi:peroxiredoxin Q/BCP